MSLPRSDGGRGRRILIFAFLFLYFLLNFLFGGIPEVTNIMKISTGATSLLLGLITYHEASAQGVTSKLQFSVRSFHKCSERISARRRKKTLLWKQYDWLRAMTHPIGEHNDHPRVLVRDRRLCNSRRLFDSEVYEGATHIS